MLDVPEICGCRHFTRLGPRDADRYADHLLRLSPEDRRLRFFGDAEDFLIELHAGAAASDKRIVAICEEDGVIRAAAELLADPTRPEVGELAFTVEEGCQRKGMGSALMKEVIDAGVQAGFQEAGAGDPARQRIHARFGAALFRADRGARRTPVRLDRPGPCHVPARIRAKPWSRSTLRSSMSSSPTEKRRAGPSGFQSVAVR